MRVADHAELSPAGAQVAALCLAMPEARGLAALQARLVDRIKRAATRHLHASRRGERLLLRMYLTGEQSGEGMLHADLLPALPGWLVRPVRQHLAEEQAHAALFAAALDAPGGVRRARLWPGGLGSLKIARWRRLAARHAPHFAHGSLVAVYATVLCAEQMAVRIMHRHCDTIGSAHALYPLVARVLADEQRHVRMCAHTLQRLVAPHETDRFAGLLAEVRAIDAAFGVSGALALYAAGLFYRALPEAARR